LLLFSCKGDKSGFADEMPPLHPYPQTIALNTEEGYIINPVTGDSIQAIKNSLGENIITGIPIPAKGKIINTERLAKPEVVPAGKPKLISTNQIVREIPKDLTIITGDKSQLKTFTPGVDTSSFVLLNSMGDTVPTGVPLSIKGKTVPCLQPQPIEAQPPQMKDVAKIDIKFLSLKQGMKSNSVISIEEDHHGNLWFGTDEGVSRYNGENFIHITEKEGLSSNNVSSILEDSHGNLWFGTLTGGVSMYDGNTFTHFTENKGLSSNSISSILEDRKGNIWFGTFDGGVSMFNDDTIIHITKKEGLSSNSIYSILEDRHGNMWFGTGDAGICMFDGDSFTHFTQKDGLSNNQVLSSLEDRKGNLWFGTRGGGLNMLAFSSDSIGKGNDVYTFTHFTDKEGLSNNIVKSLQEDRHGNIWIGIVRGGVNMYDGKSFTHFTEKQGLNDDMVMTLFEDSNDNLWVGTSMGGVSIYNANSFTQHLTQQDGLPSLYISSILSDKDGVLWLGAWGGGLYKYNDKILTRFTQKEGLNSNRINSITEDSQGNLWIGTSRGGVSKYNGVNFTHFTEEDGLINNNVSSILEDSQGNIWIGTSGGGVSKYNGVSFTHFTEKEGLSPNSIHSIIEDRHGNIWMGTSGGGVKMYNGESFTHYTEKEGLCNNIVNSILEDRHGNLWFGTEGGGACKFDGEIFTLFTEEEGLSSNSISSILEDSIGNIWISTEKGIDLLVFNPKSILPKIHSYGTEDNLKGDGYYGNSVALDSKNRIWWGEFEGITMLDMNNFMIPNTSFHLQLNRIEIKDQFIDYRQMKDSTGMGMDFSDVARFQNYPLNLKLHHKNNHLTFHFSAFNWSESTKLMFSYKMEGLNESWSQPTSATQADYRGLSHGIYTLKVRAIGAAQKWSEPIVYTFKINPPWWLTWWMYTVYSIIALLLIIGYVRLRIFKLKQRQKELENTVLERTVEISEKNDELKQQNENITDSIEYAKRIQTATLPPDEVLNELLPKHFILYRPLQIVSGDFYWLAQKQEKIIVIVADCTGHGVPGAFMSILGSALLNDIVNNMKTLQANVILNELRSQVIASLRQTGKADEARDGMDITLCIIDRENMELEYAGANNPLYHVRDGELMVIKADRMPIGISSEADLSFTNHNLALQKDDTLYLFSDGYVDQIGGERRKKFLSSRFKTLLLEIQDKNMIEQKAMLENTINEWMGLTGLYEKEYEQIDDNVVMGIKI
jgi:ligand-binding sensor domain-containing protein/serine phosphatase RsbU (regulator of sigma subunit)